MKKSTVLICLSLLIASMVFTPSEAQKNQEATRPRFGIKGGVNFSNLYAQDVSGTKMLTGFNAGLFGKITIINPVAIQPELYFTTKGAVITYDNLLVDGIARFNLNYLEVPLLIVVNITKYLNVHFGPYASFLICGRVQNESTVHLFDFEENITTSDYNKLDAGIAAGAGIDIGALSVGTRYNLGLTKVGKERTFLGIPYTFPDANNGVISLYISLSLN
ncbi:MAG: porin family protein [Bacteroidota bacterium]